MTGSALARYELRGTFHVLLLRALSGTEGEFEGENVARLSPDWAIGGFFFIGFPLGFIAFLVPEGSQDGPPTWT